MPVSTTTVLYEKKNRIAYITLNRPEVMNALNADIRRGLQEAMTDFRDDPELLVAILTGAGGRAFSAGADLREMAERTAAGQAPPRRWPNFYDLEVWKPLIAAIDGFCLAGGLEISLQCDIRICTQQSRFGQPEPRRSLLGGYGLHNLSRMIPLGEALYIMLTGGHLTSEEAYHGCLVHKVLPNRQALMEEAERIAEEIKLCAPLAVQTIKRVMLQGRNLPVEYSWKLAEPLQQWINTTEDFREGPKAFVEKRTPVWKMR